MSEQMTSKDKKVAQIMQDPALWAKHHIGDTPRWYQEQALRHPHNRTVLRWGRRLGKCIAEGQHLVDSETGQLVRIEDLYNQVGRKTFSLNNQYKLELENIFQVERNGKKPVFEIKTASGTKIELTGNHPVLTIEGWTEVDDLKVGEQIATPKSIPIFGKTNPEEKYVQILAYLLVASKRTKMGMTVELTNEETKEYVISRFKAKNIGAYPKTKQVYFILDKEKHFAEITGQENPVVPDEVFTYTKEKLAVFIASLFDVRGYTYVKHVPEIAYITDNEELCNQIRHLLLRFGIQSSVRGRNRKDQKNTVYTLTIAKKEDIETFLEEISPYGVRDYEEIGEKVAQVRHYSRMIPKEVNKYVEEKLDEKKMTKAELAREASGKFDRNRNVSEEDLAAYADKLEDGFLYDMSRSDIIWSEVKSIEPKGKKETYDVMMPAYHNLVVEDICVHNTWTMVAHMLWAAFTNIGGTKTDGNTILLVATPYDSQALLIFKQLTESIEKNEVLKNSVKRIIKNPYTIEFKNGAEIRLFTTGAKTSSGAASMRGQRADKILSPLAVRLIESSCEFRRTPNWTILSQAL